MKIKLKGIVISVMMLFMAVTLIGCSSDSADNKQKEKQNKIKVATLKGPTGIGMAKLMEEDKNDYNITLYDSPDQIISKVINGEVDMAAVPSNLASVLYNKTKGGVKLAAVNTLGNLYIVENGDTIKDIKDLKGKTIYMSGKGATPEYILNYILNKNGLDVEKDVKIEYKMQHSDIAGAMASKQISIAVLPEPFVTTTKMKNKDIKVKLDLSKEWEKVLGEKNKLVMGTLIVKSDFAKKNSKEVEEFLNKYKDSIQFCNNEKEKAGKLCEKYGIIPKANIAKQAIANCHIVFIKGKDAKASLNKFYNILKENKPKSIGGKVPDEKFYYDKN